jgi:hypothetical protein
MSETKMWTGGATPVAVYIGCLDGVDATALSTILYDGKSL